MALDLFHQLFHFEPDSMNHLDLVPELKQRVHNLAQSNYLLSFSALKLIQFALRSQNHNFQSLTQAQKSAIKYPQ